MEPDELVVSDIHVECKRTLWDPTAAAGCCGLPSVDTVLSRFVFVLPDAFADKRAQREAQSADSATSSTLDEDGDLVVCRQQMPEQVEAFEIEHGISTTLRDVGLQVWAGALIMCDFILAYPQLFCGHSCLELGAGSGLTSLTLALLAKYVICTDGNMKALGNCLSNVRRNENIGSARGQVKVRRLDWSEDTVCQGVGAFDWGSEDVQLLNSDVDVLVAADVFYDDKATTAFFGTIGRLLVQAPPKTLYVSVEKRFNFTLEDIDVTAPAYSKFRQCLSDLEGQGGVSSEMLSTDFPQYFRYDRSEQLEIWRISSRKAL